MRRYADYFERWERAMSKDGDKKPPEGGMRKVYERNIRRQIKELNQP